MDVGAEYGNTGFRLKICVYGVRKDVPNSVTLVKKVVHSIHKTNMAVEDLPMGRKEEAIPLGVRLSKTGLKISHMVK